MKNSNVVKNDVLAYRISAKYDIPFNEVYETLQAILDSITEALLNGDKVKIVDWGTFEVVRRAPRKGHNPHTGEIYDIAACNEPAWKPGKLLKEIIQDANVD